MDDPASQAGALLESLGRPVRRALPRIAPALADASHVMVPADGLEGPVSAWRLEGARPGAPAVLLVHGWEDDTSLWGPLIDLLSAQGRAVVALDLPGHGHSHGQRCDLDLAARALAAACDALGPVDAACGHSFGGPALARAVQTGLTLQRLALVAPPIDQARQFERAARRHGIDEALIAAALEAGKAAGRFFDLSLAPPPPEVETLFVHSRDDPQCPFQAAEAAARLWPGARFWPCDELGHRDVARDPEIVALLAAFLR